MKIAGIQNQGHLISTIVWWIGWTSEQNIDGNVVKIVHKTKIHLGYTFPVMYAYTASKHEGTLCTPNRMMLGREIGLPINIMYPMKEDERIMCPVAYVEWMRQAMVKRELNMATRRREKYCIMISKYKTGPSALVSGCWDGTHRHMLNNPYIGPYKVIDKHGPVTYQVQKSKKSTHITTHVDDLKPFHTKERQSRLQIDGNLHLNCRPLLEVIPKIQLLLCTQSNP